MAPISAEINASTRIESYIDSLGFNGINDMAFDSNSNTLYAVDGVSDKLVAIDRTTGTGEVLRNVSFGAVTGLAFDPNTNTLYGSDVLADVLLTINPVNGATISIGGLGFSSTRGLAFDPNTNTLYGVDTTADTGVADTGMSSWLLFIWIRALSSIVPPTHGETILVGELLIPVNWGSV